MKIVDPDGTTFIAFIKSPKTSSQLNQHLPEKKRITRNYILEPVQQTKINANLAERRLKVEETKETRTSYANGKTLIKINLLMRLIMNKIDSTKK